MSSHQDRGDKSVTQDNKHPADKHATNESSDQPKVSKLQQTLTVAKHYLQLGVVPAVALIALVVAVFAIMSNQTGEAQLAKVTAKIDILNSSLSASKSDMEKFKIAVAQEKTVQEEVQKKQQEQVARIIQNITPLQIKLKIAPTLEEQIRQAAASAVVPAATSGVPATGTPEMSKVVSGVSAAPSVINESEKKQNKQVQVMKQAIENYNKKN